MEDNDAFELMVPETFVSDANTMADMSSKVCIGGSFIESALGEEDEDDLLLSEGLGIVEVRTQ